MNMLQPWWQIAFLVTLPVTVALLTWVIVSAALRGRQ